MKVFTELSSGTIAADGRRAPTGDGFRRHLTQLSQLALVLAEVGADRAEQAVAILAGALDAGHKVLACGNGGSAADAQHFAGELVGRMLFDRAPLAAMSLTTDTSVLTALGNDYGYDNVFARQVAAFGQAGDVLVVLSTSGHSPNIVNAVHEALRRDLQVIALTGATGDDVLAWVDVWFQVDSIDTPHVQELHTAILHALCIGVEERLFLP